jgi:hypothetical protein
MYYIAVFIGLVYEWTCRRYPVVPKARLLPASIPFSKILAPTTAVLVVLFLVRLTLIRHAATDEPGPQWLSRLPIVPLYDSLSSRYSEHRQAVALCLALISVADCAALYLVYRAFEICAPHRREWTIVAIACAIMSASAVTAPALSSTDPYFYAAYAERGFAAYGPQKSKPPCPISQADAECLQPAFPNVYGPLYTTYLELLLQHVKPTVTRIELLRIANVLWVMLFILLLRALDIGSPLIAVATLNSAILLQYIGEAHNDVIAIDLILIGTLLAQRLPFLTALFVTGAALIKAPFVLFGAFAFQRLALIPKSLYAAATIVLSIAISFFWGGRPYLESLQYYSRFHNFFSTYEHRTIVVAALLAIAIGFFKNRFSIAGAYTLPALGGGSAFPWYTLWAIPYLQCDHPKLPFFIITLPITSFLMETPFQISALWYAVILTLTALAIHRILASRYAQSGSSN